MPQKTAISSNSRDSIFFANLSIPTLIDKLFMDFSHQFISKEEISPAISDLLINANK
jgi:hypothetical protein